MGRLKTVEMLAQIQMGQRAKVFNKPSNHGSGNYVEYHESGDIRWVNHYSYGGPIAMTKIVLEQYEWELVPAEVDFDTALVAVDKGVQLIRSSVTGQMFDAEYLISGRAQFTLDEIRGKWVLHQA